MSAVAKEACRIVSHIRAKELRTIWTQSLGEGQTGEPYQADEILYPGVMFTVAKERMEKTKLWEIVQKMPKGQCLDTEPFFRCSLPETKINAVARSSTSRPS